ncbi:agmatine deiminase family protein [Lactiplantibacillus sp. WILCCON 0030]|uniref:Agmatine deiminase family protein n=1 Tax=Lactiplantibacillus brownii TaxID=3069269 RepID=A0ABU1A7B6_9LACO|nr:agmatine deiminase family protein [Lactiplantibacillus brownii]MDQ7936763.1 agmatine deiminase family protein [Lactiplantibacillus brownii]
MNNDYFPKETARHEGTWLTWPHRYTYGRAYRNEIEPIWIAMTAALSHGEKVHIIAYNVKEQKRITQLLTRAKVDLRQVDFTIAKSDDVWSRDTGPIFVRQANGQLTIADFGFNGWGGKTAYHRDNDIPKAIAKATGIPRVSVPDFVLEGGSVELDGHGTALLCKSSVLNDNRNPGMSKAEAEAEMTKYLGATNFIWLDGVKGEDITDAHIDGMARLLDTRTILTVSKHDFLQLYEGINPKDYDRLHHATNAKGDPYRVVDLPMTAKNVRGLDYQGSYLNYYVGNEVVLVPTYHDKNDRVALQILSQLYPQRKIVGIDVTALYQYGGMLHCVTQQQPEALNRE